MVSPYRSFANVLLVGGREGAIPDEDCMRVKDVGKSECLVVMMRIGVEICFMVR